MRLLLFCLLFYSVLMWFVKRVMSMPQVEEDRQLYNAFRSSGAQSLILWEGIQFAAAHSKVFDFEGSMVEGIENFFRQFGGVCTPYYVVSRKTILSQLLQILKPRIKRLLGYKI